MTMTISSGTQGGSNVSGASDATQPPHYRRVEAHIEAAAQTLGDKVDAVHAKFDALGKNIDFLVEGLNELEARVDRIEAHLGLAAPDLTVN